MTLPAQSAALADHQHPRAALNSVETGAIVDNAVTSAKLNDDVYATTVTAIDPDDAAVPGTVGGRLAPFDHQHAIVTGTPAALTKTATSSESAGSGFARDTHVHATNALPWGIVARQKLTVSNGAHSANATTDFALADVPVDVTRLYRVHLHSQYQMSAATGTYTVNFFVDGVAVDRFAVCRNNAASALDSSFSAGILWEPASGTPDLDVRVTEDSGTATFLLVGTATVPRWFWVEDIGPR